MTNTNPATVPQINFINDLIKSRALTPEAKNLTDAFNEAVSKSQASKVLASLVIDSLKPLPRVQPAAPVAAPASRQTDRERLQAALQTLPKGRGMFAVDTDTLRVAYPDIKTNGDLIFLEVKTVSGTTRRLSRLVGAPGRFARWRVGTTDQTIAVIEILAANPVEYMRAFAEHYKVCGKCAAELTDQKSRERQFGPDCAKMLGIR